jgi:murein DD-endopeptidase MepM/ murein hydrolase activator NlpD
VAGRGVVTVLHPSGVRTTYEPVLPVVGVGTPVEGGDVLGTVAAGGHCAPRPCLHWGALRGRDYLDPLLLLRPVRVRLLPYGDPGRRVAGQPDRAEQSNRWSGPWVGLLVGPP